MTGSSFTYNYNTNPLFVIEIRELHGGLDYSSRASDVWALGVILMNIVCGFLPWYRVDRKSVV